MREILFRGKRAGNGEWIFGSIVHQTDYYGDRCDRWFILEGDATNDYDIDYPIEVQKETVGQYTGLTDKNGVKIFEGDILQGNEYPYYSDGKYNYYAEVVFFDDDCFAAGFCTHKNPKAKVKGISDGNCELIEDFISDNWLVIGNIYDNPELVEVIVNE